jgi:hypothetical protein
VEKAKKDGATARDIKRESLDVIKRERMKCGEGEGMNAIQYQGTRSACVETNRRHPDETDKGQMDGMRTE